MPLSVIEEWAHLDAEHAVRVAQAARQQAVQSVGTQAAREAVEEMRRSMAG
jgi:hypothetical protein